MLNFADLYDKRAEYVFFLCNRLEYPGRRAERLFQETWRRIRRQLPQLQGASEERWLCARLIEAHRKLEKQFRNMKTAKGGSPSAEARLERALLALNPEFRWPLVLRDCAGFNYSEIADILKIPVGTVKARLGRARASLVTNQEKEA